MAKVVGPLHASEARGKSGGLVYNSWRGFATVKAKHAPAQPQTAKQLAARAICVTAARAWQLLANQAAWNYYASIHTLVDWTNSPKRLSGANWYVMLSTRLARRAIAPVITPPVSAAPDPVTALTAAGDLTNVEIDWDPTPGPTINVEIWIDGPRSPGRLGSLNKARWNMDGVGTVGAANTGPLFQGQYTFYVRAISLEDGQVSPFISVDLYLS
jgi:hypothetical protein